jgi:homoserine kinase
MQIKFKVPASTSNLGPGFDVLGLALKLYNEFEICQAQCARDSGLFVYGYGQDSLPKDESNIIWQVLESTYKHLTGGKISLRDYKITVNVNVPLGSGLGSSATAVVGAIALANALCGGKMSKTEIMEKAIEIEGHPDNAVPSVMGGLCLCFNKDNKFNFVKVPAGDLTMVIVNPDFQVSTQQARLGLLKNYPISDIVFNLSRLSLLIASLCSKNYALLRTAVEDKIHEPYRIKNIPYAKEVFDAACEAGAYASFISGSGPSLASFSSKEKACGIAEKMSALWLDKGIKNKSFVLDFDEDGFSQLNP